MGVLHFFTRQVNHIDQEKNKHFLNLFSVIVFWPERLEIHQKNVYSHCDDDNNNFVHASVSPSWYVCKWCSWESFWLAKKHNGKWHYRACTMDTLMRKANTFWAYALSEPLHLHFSSGRIKYFWFWNECVTVLDSGGLESELLCFSKQAPVTLHCCFMGRLMIKTCSLPVCCVFV